MAIQLTIGIPTYNRAELLGETLESIVSQLVTFSQRDRIEILISDNGSTDQTGEVVAKWKARFPSITFSYWRNDENVGFDKNTNLLFTRAQGTFVWMFADDDVQLPGSIDYVFSRISEYPDVDVFLGNLDFYDESLKNKLHEMTLNHGVDCKCRDADEFVRLSEGRYGNLSSLIFRRQLWLDTLVPEGVGKNHIHVKKLFQSLPRCSFYIIAQPIFKARRGSVNFEKSADDMIIVPLELFKIYYLIGKRVLKKRTLRELIRKQRKYILGRLKPASRLGFHRKSDLFCLLLRYNYARPAFWLKAVYFLR